MAGSSDQGTGWSDPAEASAGGSADAVLHALLEKTSRTFALAIPLLPSPVQQDVTVAYLLFRIADTIEDGERLTTSEKLAAFERLESHLKLAALGRVGSPISPILPRPACENQDYQELLEQLPLVFEMVCRLDEVVRVPIVTSVEKSIAGMKRFVASCPASGVRLTSLDELRDYCHVVAGLVGEMLTEVFLARAPELEPARRALSRRARWFGEGLQLVNILKDSGDDEREGRRFIPRHIPRDEVFALARQDLQHASRYVAALRAAAAPPGFVAFTDLPLRLAWRTLECVADSGPGSKVTRAEVATILAHTLSDAECE